MMIFRCLLVVWFCTFAAAAAEKAAPPARAKKVPSPPPLQSCHAQASRLPSGIWVFRDCTDAPEMIALRGGSFSMGDAIDDGRTYEKPLHDVQVKAFAMGRFEVTNGEWSACVAAGRCEEPHLAADDQHGRYPVAGVSWLQAMTYVNWLAARTGQAYRLPSEAEWEYAARAGSKGSYYWGGYGSDVCSQVNVLDASGRRAHPEWYWAESCDDHFADAAPVGSFPPNAWGFHDTLGNVWEWVADCWHSDYTDAPTDGSAWLTGSCGKHVNRGGGWGNNLQSLRLSNRDADGSSRYSDSLGFRVARSVGSGELPQVPETKPENGPVPSYVATASNAPHGGSAGSPTAAAGTATLATSLAVDRQFEVHLTIQGDQNWKAGMGHTQGTTKQDYVLSTRLHSDGVLYGDNLLDLDSTTRFAVKQQYLTRLGLIAVKRTNGGKLPQNAQELLALTAKIQADSANCIQQDQCAGGGVERSAALGALQNNSVADLEALIATPATGDAARWLYFFGYAGCPIRIHVTNETHIAGERAFDRKKAHPVPWSVDRSANTDGSTEDRAALCQRYTATVDVRTGDVYLENFYIPSAPGTTVRSINGSVERVNDNLPVPDEVLSWSTVLLRKTRESLNTSVSLAATAPLDGDYTALGSFDGKLLTTLSWSFKPVAGAPLAVVPPAEPAR